MVKNILKKIFGSDESKAASPEPAKPQSSKSSAPAEKERASRSRRDRPSRNDSHPRGNREPRQDEKPDQEKPDAKPWSLDQFVVEPEEGKKRFHDFDIPESIMHAIHDVEFKYCTPVQAEVLEPAMKGNNVMAQAQTGTGKTAAFLISTFSRFLRLDHDETRPNGCPRMLVIAPTRELVIQILEDAKLLGKHSKMRCVALYGGMDYEKQQRQLARGPVDLIAATPGRLLDFCRQRIVDLGKVDTLVIDEADRMLDMGFIPDVKQIVGKLPRREHRVTMLFSATLSDDVRRLGGQWSVDPVIVEVEPEQVAVDTVDQIVYLVSSGDKFKLLYNMLKQGEMTRVLVFGNRRDKTQKIADYLDRYGIDCGLLSGAVQQKKRLSILNAFKEGKVPVLVATDVAGRGIHVDDISHVVNFDFPYEPEDYVHRIGRTGRAGAEGIAISFACEDESFIIPEIEAYIGKPLKCAQPEEALLKELPRPVKSGPPRDRDLEERPRDGQRSRNGQRGPGAGRSRGPRSGDRSRPRTQRSSRSPGGSARRPA